MGKRGEVYSTRTVTEDGRKTFFFNVKQNFYGDYFLSIVESRKMDSGFRRSTIIVFDNHLHEFIVRLEQFGNQQNSSSRPVKFSVGDGRREYKISILQGRNSAVKIAESREDSTGSHRDAIIMEITFLDIFLTKLRGVAHKIEELPKDSPTRNERDFSHTQE